MNSGFAYDIAIVANIIKIAEALVFLWGARQLWLYAPSPWGSRSL